MQVAALLAGALVTVLVAAPSFASTDRWAAWSPVEGAPNAFRLTMTQRSPGSPTATLASDSRSPVQLGVVTAPAWVTVVAAGAVAAGASYVVGQVYDNWDDITDTVSDTWDNATDTIGDAWDSVTPW